MLFTKRVAVPWYKKSGGIEGSSCKSISIECPWFARMLEPSSEMTNLCLSLFFTMVSIISRSRLNVLLDILALHINSLILAQPYSSKSSCIVSG